MPKHRGAVSWPDFTHLKIHCFLDLDHLVCTQLEFTCLEFKYEYYVYGFARLKFGLLELEWMCTENINFSAHLVYYIIYKYK